MRRLAPAFPAFLAFLALLAACAEPTAYAPADPGAARPEGYAEFRVEPGRWRVSFSGNSVTSRERVETALLYRAAEVALREEGEWFLVVSDTLETEVRQVTTGTGFPAFAGSYYYGWGGGYAPFGSLAYLETREYKRFTATAEILVMRGPKPEGDGAAYDAAAVIADLRPRVIAPPAG